MTCKGLTDFIADYVEGDLPPLLRTTFEEHLAACPEYVAYLTSYRETIALGRAAATSSDGSVPEELMRAIVQLRAAARVVHRKSVAGVDDPWSRLGTGTRSLTSPPPWIIPGNPRRTVYTTRANRLSASRRGTRRRWMPIARGIALRPLIDALLHRAVDGASAVRLLPAPEGRGR